MSRLFEGLFVPGTVFTGDSDLCKMLLASVPEVRTMRSGGRRAVFRVSQKLCICWARVGRTLGSLRHCVEAGLFAITGSLERSSFEGAADLLAVAILRWARASVCLASLGRACVGRSPYVCIRGELVYPDTALNAHVACCSLDCPHILNL